MEPGLWSSYDLHSHVARTRCIRGVWWNASLRARFLVATEEARAERRAPPRLAAFPFPAIGLYKPYHLLGESIRQSNRFRFRVFRGFQIYAICARYAAASFSASRSAGLASS